MTERAAETHARELRKHIAMNNLAFFTTYYFVDDDMQPIVLETFHVDFLNDIASDEREMDSQLHLLPGGHGKTTLAMIYTIWRMIRYRNARILFMGKTFDDAKARVRSIKAELEDNEKLIADFGPFVTDKWTDSELNIAGRTTRAKESTLTAVGSETNIFGSRATDFVGDDLVTIENSGPQVTPATRERFKENFNQGIRKLGVPRCRMRWINTVVDLRDMCHDVMKVNGGLPPDDYERWVSDKGWLVVRRRALNEDTGDTLWPAMFTRDMLEAERLEDPVAFAKRRQNRVIETGMLTFQHEWIVGDPSKGIPGCLDFNRVFGQFPDRYIRIGGFDPTAGQTATSKWCGWVEVAFDRNVPLDEPLELVITEIAQFRVGIEEQGQFLVDRGWEHHLAGLVIEENGAHQYLGQLNTIRRARRAGLVIEPHFTKPVGAEAKQSAAKPDPIVGIASMANLAQHGLIRFPYGDVQSKRMSDLLIAEMEAHPMSATSDLLMALWFCYLYTRRVRRRSGLRVIAQHMPKWIRDRSVTPTLPWVRRAS